MTPGRGPSTLGILGPGAPFAFMSWTKRGDRLGAMQPPRGDRRTHSGAAPLDARRSPGLPDRSGRRRCASDGDALRARGVGRWLFAERKRYELEPEASAIASPESRGYCHGTSSSSNLQPTPSTRTRTGRYTTSLSRAPPWTALPEPTQRTLTELLTCLLVSHAGEPIALPAGSDADER